MIEQHMRRNTKIILIICCLIVTIVIVSLGAYSLRTVQQQREMTAFRTAFVQGEYERCLELYSELDEQIRLSSEPLFLYGIAHHALSQRKDEREMIHRKQVIESLSLFTVLYPSISETLPLLHQALGVAYHATGQYEQAIASLTASGNTDSHNQLLIGTAYGNLNDPVSAEPYLLRYDAGPRTYAYLFSLFRARGMRDKALEYLMLLIDETTEDEQLYDLYRTRAEFLDPAGQEIIQSYRSLLGRITDPILMSNVYLLLGDIYRKRGQLIEAQSMWDTSLSLDPDNTETRQRLRK